MNQELRETSNFRLFQRNGKFVLEAKHPSHPKRATVSEKDVAYLQELPDASFDGAAVWDFGVGVFA